MSALEAPIAREVPELTDLNTAFWTGGEADELRIMRCQSCGFWLHPPSPMCPACHSLEIRPEVAAGKGRVFSYTVNHRAWRPGLAVPYVIALVELAEQPGLRLTTNVVGCRPEDVYMEMPVRVSFLHQPPVWIPLFEPDMEPGERGRTA